MSGVWYFWGSLALLMAGYLVYGSVVEKVFGADAKRPTPLHSKNDGVDYVGLPRYKIFLIQFLKIRLLIREANGAVFLASDRASFITGDMLAVCGGGQFITMQ